MIKLYSSIKKELPMKKIFSIVLIVISVLSACKNTTRRKNNSVVSETSTVSANLSLSLFQTIRGVGAASGLVYEAPFLNIVSDNSDVLYRYNLQQDTLLKVNLREDDQWLENRLKKQKSDYESIIKTSKGFQIMASGSKKKRHRWVNISKSDFKAHLQSAEQLYDSLKAMAHIDKHNFNIEGSVLSGDTLLLFNRGNGPNVQNGIFQIINYAKPHQKISFHPIELPTIKSTAYGFTDATKVGSKIYFLAAAEANKSNYADGAILGSLLGRIDWSDLSLQETTVISKKHKFEGITPYRKKGSEISFLLCEDPDNDQVQTTIYKLSVPLPSI